MKTVLSRPPVSPASCAAVPYRSAPADLSTVPVPKPLSWLATKVLTAAAPPAIWTVDGLSLVSSVLTVAGRTPFCGTRRSGPPCAAATGPAASASGKLAPDATVTANFAGGDGVAGDRAAIGGCRTPADDCLPVSANGRDRPGGTRHCGDRPEGHRVNTDLEGGGVGVVVTDMDRDGTAGAGCIGAQARVPPDG